MDTNKVWLSGLVISPPVLTKISENTPFCTFDLQVNEKYTDKRGRVQFKKSIFRIESLGKGALSTSEKVLEGQRYFVDGYIRQDIRDGVDDIRIRTFAVYRDDSVDGINYGLGLQKALEVLRKSMDKNSAIIKLEELIAAE